MVSTSEGDTDYSMSVGTSDILWKLLFALNTMGNTQDSCMCYNLGKMDHKLTGYLKNYLAWGKNP